MTMRSERTNAASAMSCTSTTVVCAAAASALLIIRTLSLSLSVLLLSAVVLCGLLIGLALRRVITPKEQS